MLSIVTCNITNKKSLANCQAFLTLLRVRTKSELTLGVLRTLTRFVQTNFLTLNFTSISRNKAGFRQNGFQIRIVFDQSARNSVTHSSCLP